MRADYLLLTTADSRDGYGGWLGQSPLGLPPEQREVSSTKKYSSKSAQLPTTLCTTGQYESVAAAGNGCRSVPEEVWV